jgi:hypothetical protein
MRAQQLQAISLAFREIHWRARRGDAPPTMHHVRHLARELEVGPQSISDPDDLPKANGAVIRDGEGWVCELMGGVWYAVRSTRSRTPVCCTELPAWVLDAGEDES